MPLTIMVNNGAVRLITYELPPNPLPEERRFLKLRGPRYHLDRVQASATSQNTRLFTAKCEADVRLLKWTLNETVELLHALEQHHYHSSEWCRTGKGMTIDCDAYLIKFDTSALEPSDAGIPLYVKFGFGPTSAVLLIISCHEGFDET